MVTFVAAPQDLDRERNTALRESVADVAPNVNRGRSEEIAEIYHQGIEVYDDNEPAPDNAHKFSASCVASIRPWCYGSSHLPS